MTRAEAQAANVVIRWVFNVKPLTEPADLLAALLVLADGSYDRLREGVTIEQVREWARIHS